MEYSSLPKSDMSQTKGRRSIEGRNVGYQILSILMEIFLSHPAEKSLFWLFEGYFVVFFFFMCFCVYLMYCFNLTIIFYSSIGTK